MNLGDSMADVNKIVLGLTGAFGSGCTTIATDFIKPLGFNYISLSSILKEKYKEEKGSEPDSRDSLQDFGNELRKNKGCDYLAQCAIERIKQESGEFWVVECFRNPHEVHLFRSSFLQFYLIGIFADYQKRWDRIKDKYNEDQSKFKKDELRDKGEKFEYGQRVTDCFLESDIIIANNDGPIIEGNDNYSLLSAKIKRYIDLIKKPFTNKPTEEETLMSIAYANSYRSSCLKRKVGAIIIDKQGNLFSSGYNEVPREHKPCKNEFGGCYRDKTKRDLKEFISKHITDQTIVDDIVGKFKILELCRALHAEENAIINVARSGSSTALKDATLYTTTYPCNLCANKIANVGIKRVIYFEPYPQQEAKDTLDHHNIDQKIFEGVTYKSYFRLYR